MHLLHQAQNFPRLVKIRHEQKRHRLLIACTTELRIVKEIGLPGKFVHIVDLLVDGSRRSKVPQSSSMLPRHNESLLEDGRSCRKRDDDAHRTDGKVCVCYCFAWMHMSTKIIDAKGRRNCYPAHLHKFYGFTMRNFKIGRLL